jgi:hypothetical protein
MGTKMAPEIGAIKNLPAEKSMGRDCGAKDKSVSDYHHYFSASRSVKSTWDLCFF